MPGMGPVPKPADQRRRRNATVPMQQLPAGGRPGAAPAFPLTLHVDERMRLLEAQIWADLWATPQAVVWERSRWLRDVALYARYRAAAELGSMKAAAEARQLGDRLGLNPQAMLRLRWEIAPDELGEVRSAKPATNRARLRIAATD